MTVHLVKLSVGAENIDDLMARVAYRVEQNKTSKFGPFHDHVTRMFPRRDAELLDGGSLYWVVKGNVLARQKIIGLEKVTGGDGIERCAILLNPQLVRTQLQPRRAFQGWRYLEVADAPLDVGAGRSDLKKGRGLPPELSMELNELGLL